MSAILYVVALISAVAVVAVPVAAASVLYCICICGKNFVFFLDFLDVYKKPKKLPRATRHDDSFANELHDSGVTPL